MSKWPTLELVKRLLEEHEFGGAESRLIPCVHHDVASEIDFLTAAARRYDGQLYDLSSEDSWVAPPSPIDEHRADLVVGLLKSMPGAFPGEPVFEIVDGKVVARVSNDEIPNEPSLRLLLRAASVLASSALEQVEITIICGSSVESDSSRRELLWKLLTIDPQDLMLNEPKTVVTIVSGKIDPISDYERQPLVRYVVLHDRVLKRTDADMAAPFRAIANHERPIVIFLGAGASASSGIRLGDAYRNIALRELLGRDNQATNLALDEQFFQYLHDRDRFLTDEGNNRDVFLKSLTLERVLRETFHELGAKPRLLSTTIAEIAADCGEALEYVREGRKSLHRIIESLQGRIVVATVNFDRLIEDGLEVENQVIATRQDFGDAIGSVEAYLASPNKLPVPILKIHGSIDNPNSLIATIDSTAQGLTNEVRELLQELLNVSSGSPLTWFWIGCSMRDRDLNSWLNGLSSEALDEWWVDPFPGISLDDFFRLHREPAWKPRDQKLRDRLVVESADRFFKQLDRHLDGT